MKKLSVLFAVALFAATPALAAEEPAKGPAQTPFNCDFEPNCEVAPGIYGALQAPTTSKFNLAIGGFVKLDYAYNSVNFGPTGFLTPSNVPKRSSIQGQRDQSILSVRQSRLWFKTNGPTLLGAKTTGLVEFDFHQGDNSNNLNPSPRLRHAYANIDWGKTQVLFGQSGDNFGILSGNTVDFNSGAQSGFAPGTRNPQIRLTQRVNLSKDNSLKLVLAVQTPYQENNSTSGTAGSPGTTGDTWGVQPNVVGQALFISKALGVAPGYYGLSQNNFTAGFFGLYGNNHIQGQSEKLDSWGAGFYTFVPVLRSVDGKNRARTLSFEGQTYLAANLNANGATGANTVRPGGVGTDLKAAKGYGIAGQFILYTTQDLGISAGYGRRNAINYANYRNNTNFEKYNELVFANVSYDLNAAIRVATEYQHLKTKYGNVASGAGPLAGTADTGEANIARLALYYFF
ncbi:MAG: hypothetical protein HYS23_08160 [Geobacter sp.]|nr:hypothetical protein [Geobacter sp.]